VAIGKSRIGFDAWSDRNVGRSIVITGAGSGLGRALARRLAGSGNALFLMGRNAGKLEAIVRELPGACPVICDVADPGSVADAFAHVAGQAPRLDVLINNAGLFEPSMIAEASDRHIRSILDTNLTGAIHCARAAIPMMGKGSQIISIGSETVVIPIAMLALYQASKAGLDRFSQTLKEEVASQGIRVTMVRAGKMFEPEMEMPYDSGLYQRFAEENQKRGIRPSAQALSHYASVAAVLASLLELPEDVAVPHIVLEGRFA
jgi:NAD(P)-dependent dehydrogenase (short-subunit alcohol dehydrogenase family)